MTKPRFQLECLEGRLTPTVSFFLVPPEVPSGAYSIGSYDSDQPDAAQPTVAILGLAEGDTPVFLAESADSTSSLLLASSASGFEATLYTIDTSTAQAAVIGSSASISLLLADGSAVAFPVDQNFYSAGLDESGQLLIDVVNESFVTRFRVDPATGLAIDGDSETDGTQPDAILDPVTCELPPVDPFDQPEIIVDPVFVTELPTVSGIDGSETLVSLVTAGETTYGLAVNADADTATLYFLSTVDDVSTATAIAGVGSIALVLSDGSPVDFTANSSDYVLELNTDSGAIVVSALSGFVQTQFRVDPSTGLAIDGDEEADGTQPDAVFVPVTCELPPAEPDDQPEIIVDPVDPPSPQPVDQNYNYIPVQGWFNTIISGIDSSETLVSYTTDGESAYALAVNGDANTATLYQISTLDDVSTATAVGIIGSIALSLADGNSVEFSIYSGQYITEVDADGNLIVCEHNAGLLTTFRVDLTTGLAIDADVEADGTQPDSSLTVVQDVTPPPEWWDIPISIVMPPVPWLPAVGGIRDSEVLVSVVSTGDVTYGLAVDAAANVATLYLVSTVEDISTATAIGEFGSIALVNADGSVVVFTDYAADYVVEVDADGNIGVRAFNNNLQTSFRIDPSTGLAIDGDAGVEGTQPDSIEFVRRYEPRYVAYNYRTTTTTEVELPAIGGIDSSETLVSVVTAGEVTYALAVNDEADTATLYLVSTVNDESTATAVGDIGSVALTFASGGAVELTANPSDYSLDVDADGNVVVRAFFGSIQRSFRIDPTSGLAIDGDAEAEGTQPDYVLAVCYSAGPPVALNDGEFEPEWAYRTNDDGDSTIDPRILYSTGSSNGGSESLSLNFFAFCDDTGSEPMLYASAQTSAPAPALTYSTTGGKVVMVTADGRTGSFTPFVGYDGSVHTATGDINGDRIMDVVVVPAVVGAPGHIRVLSGADGSSIASFICFPGYLGSIDIAVVDINGDGFDDIIASSTGGASGTVAIFNGRDFSAMKTFYPYGAGYMGTVHVSGYDPDGDGAYSILTSTGEGTRGHVKAFDQNLDVFLSFFSGAEGDLSGCYVIGGDLDGDGLDDIATGTGAGTEAEVHVFDGNTGSRRHSMKVFSGYMGGANLEMISSATNPLAMDLVVGSGDGSRGTLNVIDGREFEVIDAYFAEGDAEESTEGIVF